VLSIKKLALRDDRMQIAECRRQIQKIKIGRWGDGETKEFWNADCGMRNTQYSQSQKLKERL
jgi:hypothetical protein